MFYKCVQAIRFERNTMATPHLFRFAGLSLASAARACGSVIRGARRPRAGTMRIIWRGVAVWLCVIIVEVFHGLVRTLFLAPVLGDFRARQVAVFTGSVLILMVATVFIRWIRPANAGEAVAIGTLWLVLTLAFEIVFGRYILRASWSRIASDYNLLRGGLLPIGLFVLTAAPVIAAKIRRIL